jgi:hypothetical protein
MSIYMSVSEPREIMFDGVPHVCHFPIDESDEICATQAVRQLLVETGAVDLESMRRGFITITPDKYTTLMTKITEENDPQLSGLEEIIKLGIKKNLSITGA